jgi:hypothetical protein
MTILKRPFTKDPKKKLRKFEKAQAQKSCPASFGLRFRAMAMEPNFSEPLFLGGIGVAGAGVGLILPVLMKATFAVAVSFGTFLVSPVVTPVVLSAAVASVPVLVTIGGVKVIRMAALSRENQKYKLQLLDEDISHISPNDELEVEACATALETYKVHFLFSDPEPETGIGMLYSWRTSQTSDNGSFAIQEWGQIMEHPRRVVMFEQNYIGAERNVIPLAECPDAFSASYLLAVLSALEAGEEFNADRLYQHQTSDKTFIARLVGLSASKFLETKSINYLTAKDEPITGDGLAYSWRTLSSSLDGNFLVQEWGQLMSHEPRLVMASPHDPQIVCPF